MSLKKETIEKHFERLLGLLNDDYSSTTCLDAIKELDEINGFTPEYIDSEIRLVRSIKNKKRLDLLDAILSLNSNYSSYLDSFDFGDFSEIKSLDNDWIIFDNGMISSIRNKLKYWKKDCSDSDWAKSQDLSYWLVKYIIEEILGEVLEDVDILLIAERGFKEDVIFSNSSVKNIKAALNLYDTNMILNSFVLDSDFSMEVLLPFDCVGERIIELELTVSALSIDLNNHYPFEKYRSYPACALLNHLRGFVDGVLYKTQGA